MTTTFAPSSSDLHVPARDGAGGRREDLPGPDAHRHDHAHPHRHDGHDHGRRGDGVASAHAPSETGNGHDAAASQGVGHRRVVAPPSGLSLIRASLAARLAVAAGLSVLIWAAVLWARLPIAS